MNKKKYITGIDGLRSIAVLGVIVYHLIPDWAPGGYLGVPLFFVISGYLMTEILLLEWDNRSKIKLKEFYYKRIRRIYPSLIIMLVISGGVMIFLSKDLLLNFRSITLSSLFNVNNWWQVANDVSYFDRFGNESPFTHLWSLSIEGQFYIAWPILLALLMYKQEDNKRLSTFTISMTVLSALLMIAFYHPENVDRLYYGTDTRLFSILIGACLSLGIRKHIEKLEGISDRWQMVIFGCSLFGVISGYLFLPASSSFVYQGGMFLYSLTCAILLACIILYSRMNRWLTNHVFSWIGSRSYEIYLWQFPVMIVYENTIKVTGDYLWVHLLIQLIIILILSELTFRFVSFCLYQVNWKNRDWTAIWSSNRNKVLIGILTLIMSLFIYGFVSAPSGSTDTSLRLKQKLEENKKEVEKKNQSFTSETRSETSKDTASTQSTNSSSSSTVEDSVEEIGQLTVKEKELASNINLGAVGDSVLLSAAPDLQEVFKKNHVDAEVGRQLEESEPVFKKLAEKKQLGDVTLIVLGTNGSFDESDIDAIMKYIGEKPVFFVNTMVERPWQKSVNDELSKAVKRYDNAHLIDWKEASSGHPEWFEEDNVHVNAEGGQAFTAIVTKEILGHVK